MARAAVVFSLALYGIACAGSPFRTIDEDAGVSGSAGQAGANGGESNGDAGASSNGGAAGSSTGGGGSANTGGGGVSGVGGTGGTAGLGGAGGTVAQGGGGFGGVPPEEMLDPYPAPNCPGFTAYNVPLNTCISITGRFETRTPMSCNVANPMFVSCATVSNTGQCPNDLCVSYVRAEPSRQFTVTRHDLVLGACPQVCALQ